MAPADGPLPRVQNFKVHKLLGKGSYGKVYKVQRESDDKYYALKETDLGGLSQMERMDAVNEVRLLVSINHPSVIRYHEAFLNGNKLCVVMEYAPFGDLKYYISKGQRLSAPFPEEAIWRIFLQLCKGLSALHAQNIIHRDIKPANIFLCQNDLLKIGDLGVAKALTRLDYARTQIGTPVYMAPEVWTGKLYSYSSDLWSLGCVLYEMMTFRVPIEGRSMQELKVKVSSGRYTPIAQGRYSTELIGFCHGLLTVDPKRRPTPDAILSSSAASKWMRVLPGPATSAVGPSGEKRSSDNVAAQKPVKLMNTIMVPRDIKQLPKVLPPPSYDPSPRDQLPSPKDQAPSRDQVRSQVPQPPGLKPGAVPPSGRPLSGAARTPLNYYPGAYRPAVPGAALPKVPQPPVMPSALQRRGSEDGLVPGIRPGARRITYN